jgi:uncharacterized iron-regulated membrane protein
MATGRPRSGRVILRRIHLWLGLSLGLVFALAGLTGSALVFYPEIDNALVPALRAVPAHARPPSWQAVHDRLRHDHPTRTGAWGIEVTPGGGPIPVRYYTPVETKGRAFAPLMLWLDPRDLSAVRAGFWGEYPTTWLDALHWQLLSGKTGEIVMGLSGFGMLAMLVTGLAVWWPRVGQWRRGLHWKPRAATVRRLYDVHKLVGVASFVVLIVVTATGVMLELPDQVRPAIGRLSPLFVAPKPNVQPRSGLSLSLDSLAERGQSLFPHSELAWIETPASSTSAVRINLWQPGEPSRRFPRTNVWLDPFTGTVLAIRDGRRESAGDVALNWLHPLHGGEALGMSGRLLVLLSGVAAVTLAATGWWRWFARRKHGRAWHY